MDSSSTRSKPLVIGKVHTRPTLASKSGLNAIEVWMKCYLAEGGTAISFDLLISDKLPILNLQLGNNLIVQINKFNNKKTNKFI